MFRTVVRWHLIYSSFDQASEKVPPNTIRVIFIAGRKLCLINGSQGLFAIDERCPHNGFSLSRGWCSGDGSAVVCPLHRYAFDLKTGRSQNGGGGAARVYPIDVRDDGVFIGLEEREWGWFPG
jgi:3-phenylpropionate/trans-cinnamate dioxygenase ferredoxin subunit